MKITRKSNRLNFGISGQSAAEFALAMPIMLIMMVAIFEFSRLIWTFSAISSASREAVRYAAGAGDEEIDTPNYLDCSGISDIAIEIGAPGNVTVSDVEILYDHGPGTAQISGCPSDSEDIFLGDRMIVNVTGYFDPIPLLIINIPPFEISSESSRTIIKEININD